MIRLRGQVGRDYGIVEALPTTPTPAVGDRCTYKYTAQNGIYWELIYTGEATYPWAKVGGSPVYVKTTPGTQTNSAFNTTTIPILTYPLSGDYLVRYGVSNSVRNNTAGDSGFFRTAYFSNGVESDSNLGRVGANGGILLTSALRHSARTAGQQADTRYKSDGGLSTVWEGVFLELNAIRVG